MNDGGGTDTCSWVSGRSQVWVQETVVGGAGVNNSAVFGTKFSLGDSFLPFLPNE